MKILGSSQLVHAVFENTEDLEGSKLRFEIHQHDYPCTPNIHDIAKFHSFPQHDVKSFGGLARKK